MDSNARSRGDDRVSLERDGALDELIVPGIGLDDRELRGLSGERQVGSAREKVEELGELAFTPQPESDEDGRVFLDDRRGQAESQFAGLPELDDLPGISAEE